MQDTRNQLSASTPMLPTSDELHALAAEEILMQELLADANAFAAYDDGTLAQAPYALDAWLDYQQHAVV